MDKYDKISIIIPVYNVEDYIERTLISLVNQPNDNLEIIIVNDGSTDNTQKIVKNILESGDKDFLIINQKNMGVSAARNAGIEKSTGKYLFFLDGDDFVGNNFFENKIRKIEEDNLDALFCGYDIVNEKEKIISFYEDNYSHVKKIISGKKAAYKILRNKINVRIGNIIFKKKIIINNDIRFSESINYGEDQEFNMMALIECERITAIKDSKMYYLKRDDSATGVISKKRLDVIHVYEDLIEYLKRKQEFAKIQELLLNFNIPKSAMHILVSHYLSEKKIQKTLYSKLKNYISFYKFKFIFLDVGLFLKIILFKINPGIIKIIYRRFYKS